MTRPRSRLVSNVCEYLARDAKEAKSAYGKARARLLEHDFGRAEKCLKGKYKAHFTEDGLKRWREEADKAWKYLDARRRQWCTTACFRRMARVLLDAAGRTAEKKREDSAPIAYCLTPHP